MAYPILSTTAINEKVRDIAARKGGACQDFLDEHGDRTAGEFYEQADWRLLIIVCKRMWCSVLLARTHKHLVSLAGVDDPLLNKAMDLFNLVVEGSATEQSRKQLENVRRRMADAYDLRDPEAGSTTQYYLSRFATETEAVLTWNLCVEVSELLVSRYLKEDAQRMDRKTARAKADKVITETIKKEVNFLALELLFARQK